MKEAKLFNNGQSQAVRLPKEFKFSGKSVYIKKQGNNVILIPEDKPWQSMFSSCEEFTADFMSTREQGTQQERERFKE